MKITISLALTTLSLLAPCLPVSAQQAPSGNSVNGKTLFFEHGCYSCHGYHGAGRVALSGKPIGLLANEATFLSFLRMRGELNPLLPSTTMPHYGVSSLPDQAALDIYAYILSFREDSPAVENVPVLKAILDDTRARGPKK
jgi:mono/diheme cytochrome c family protein